MNTQVNHTAKQLKLSSFQIPFEIAIQEQLPMVMWQLPKSKTRHLVIDFRERLKQQKLDLETFPAGFAISPFINADGQETYFIHADLHFQWKNKEIELIEAITKNENHLVEKKERFLTKLASYQSQPNSDFQIKTLTYPEQESYYQQTVQQAIYAIQEGQFDKVVLARQTIIQVLESQDWTHQFEKLCKYYPSAFVYLFHLPNVGTWLGATPETLISVDKNQIFRTMSLAGTQSFKSDKKPSQALWSQKEIEEQALVSRYIIDCFKKIRLREFKEDGPKTVVAGNLMHLRTTFEVNMKATNFPQLGTVMSDLLHPTSAVCGMPKAPSLQFIKENEDFDRAFYSGFLGPVNIKEESHLFVNLRCMQIKDKQAILYAGAGITADSIPEKEWKETEMKSQTLLNTLQKK